MILKTKSHVTGYGAEAYNECCCWWCTIIVLQNLDYQFLVMILTGDVADGGILLESSYNASDAISMYA